MFVTDKAFHEKSVLLEIFPVSRQLLCTFHIVTWLERQAGRLSTGTQEHNGKLKATLASLVSARHNTSKRRCIYLNC